MIGSRLLAAAVALAIPVLGAPAEPAKIAERYADGHTMAIARVDLGTIELTATADRVASVVFDPEADVAPDGEQQAAQGQLAQAVALADSVRAALVSVGVEEIYVFWSLRDFPRPLPFVVVPGGSQQHARAIGAVIPIAEGGQDPQTLTKSVLGSDVVLATSTIIERLRQDIGSLDGPNATIERKIRDGFGRDADIALLFAPGPEVVAVLEAMLPSVPGYGGSITTVTRGMRSVLVEIDTGANPSIEITIDSDSPVHAQQLADLARRVVASARTNVAPDTQRLALETIAAALPEPRDAGLFRRLSGGDIDEQLRFGVVPSIIAQRNVARSQKALSQVHAISLAMFYYAENEGKDANDGSPFPASLQSLVDAQHIAESLIEPRAGVELVYLRPAKPFKAYESPGRHIVVYERALDDAIDPVAVGFLDGHSELLTPGKLAELIDP